MGFFSRPEEKKKTGIASLHRASQLTELFFYIIVYNQEGDFVS